MHGAIFRPLMLAAVLLLYLAAASLSLQFVAQPENIAYFWPAAGIAAGALCVAPKAWRLQMALAIALAVILANLGTGRSAIAITIFTLGNTLEAVLFVAIAERLAGTQLRLASIRDVNILIASAAVAAIIAALILMAMLLLSGESDATPIEIAITSTLADFAGLVAVAPMIIVLGQNKLPRWDGSLREGGIALALLGVVAFIGYHQDHASSSWTNLTAFSATLPFLLWIAARAPRQITAAAPALVAFILVEQTVRGYGPYAHPAYPTDARVTAAQFELIIFAVLALYLGALFSGYRRALEEVSAKRTELESRFSELEALYAEAPLGLGMLDADLRFVRINEALAEMNGFSASQHIGRSVWDMVPALKEEAEPLLRQVLETGEPMRDLEIHGTTPAKPGQMREWCEQYYPIKSGGHVVGIGVVCEEVTDKRRAQERERLLSREVDHRAKNLLAVVHSIVQLSQGEDIARYREAISSRIHSLARTHSLLAGSRWEGAGLRLMVSEELSPFLRSGRTSIDGPDVQLGPAATQDLALVLHELATNAAKYGALSSPDGHLSVHWEVAPSDCGSLLTLFWKETGGPEVHPPSRQGFGSALVEATLSGDLRGSSSFDWQADGLKVTLHFPLPQVPPRSDAGSRLPAVGAALPMSDRPLAGRRVLLIEDEPLIGLHAQSCLEAAGCAVVGPIARIEPAMAAAREAAFDFAILDINLAGQMTFGVADLLMTRGRPFTFCSGYAAASDIPERFADIPVLRKPLSEASLIDAVARLDSRTSASQ